MWHGFAFIKLAALPQDFQNFFSERFSIAGRNLEKDLLKSFLPSFISDLPGYGCINHSYKENISSQPRIMGTHITSTNFTFMWNF